MGELKNNYGQEDLRYDRDIRWIILPSLPQFSTVFHSIYKASLHKQEL